jgi:periplasmic protein TonB
MVNGSVMGSAETQPLIAYARPPEDQPSEIAARNLARRSLAASLGIHAAILALILTALLDFSAPNEEAAIRVTLTSLGPGSAGASGGTAGGGGAAAEASNPPPGASAEPAPQQAAESSVPLSAPTAEAQETPAQDQPAAAATLAFEPPSPPRRKPLPPAHPSAPARSAQPSAAPATPAAATAQLAAAPFDMPVPGATGQGRGPGGTAGLGTGAAGSGHGAIGDGPIDGPGDDYLERLRRWLNKYKHYPEEAQKQNQRGQLVVSFTILRDGTVRMPRIERSSGFPLLDEAALQMLRSASPVPPLPEKFRAPDVAVDLPVEFSIGFFDRIF